MADYLVWINQLISNLDACNALGHSTVEYLNEHGIRVSVHDQPTGARWTVDRQLQIQPRFVTGPPDDPYALSLVVHEVRHLQQGLFTALSVYGEFEAWQLQFNFIKSLTGHYHGQPEANALLTQLMSLSLGWDRGILQRVRQIMREYGGKRYRIDLLPLYPLHREILYWLTGHEPAQ